MKIAANLNPHATFRELLTAAINDMAATGYVSPERLAAWIAQLRNAAEFELGSDRDIDEEIRKGLEATLERFIGGRRLDQIVEGVGRYTKAMVKPRLYAELDRRIIASADLIKLHKREAVERTLRRFAGWSTSIPPGGDETIDKRETKALLGKGLRDYRFERRRVDTDQGHKLISNVAAIVAEEAGAIAMQWNSHGAHDPSYNARPEHLKRDGKTYLIRDSWAHRDGLVKPINGYTDDITAPGQEISCRCWGTYTTTPRRLPDVMLTRKGQEWIARGRARLQGIVAGLFLVVSMAVAAPAHSQPGWPPIYGSNATGATVIPTGGNSPETLGNALSNIVYPQAWSTTLCTGGNDTGAIQGAINAAAGKARVHLTNVSAVCNVNSLSIPSNSHIIIDATVKLNAAINACLLNIVSGASNIVIEGNGKLDGNASAQSAAPSGGVCNAGTSASNIWVRNLTITNFYNWPVNLVGVNGAWISNLTLTNSGNSVEFAAGSTNCWADKLYISGIADGAFSFYGGCVNCGITNSFVTGSILGIGVYNDGGQTAAGHDILVSGNSIWNNQHMGFAVTTAPPATAKNYNVQAVNNDIYQNDTAAVQIGGVQINNAYNVFISNNRIHNDGNSTLTSAGIQLDNTTTNVSIIGNLIYDEGIGSGLGVGITFGNGAVNVAVIGNKIFDDQATMTTAYAMNGTVGAGAQIYGNSVGPTIGTAVNATFLSDTEFLGPYFKGGPINIQQAGVAVTTQHAVTVGALDFSVGDSVAANQNSIMMSHKTGSASGSYALLGFNVYNTGGITAIQNSNSGGFALSVDSRNGVATPPLVMQSVNSSAASTTEGTWQAPGLTLQGGTPTISSGACGTGTNGTISGYNDTGKITISSAATTACAVSFSASFTTAPSACTVAAANSTAAAVGTTQPYVSALSASGFTLSGAALASTSWYYHCL